MSSICLNMIVKNEAHVIRRCLASVKPFIHAWVVVDTGSTDGTQALIASELAPVPGELHQRPWKDFGHNRTEALRLAQGRADYTLVVDADEVLVPSPGFRMPPLYADEVQVRHEVGDTGTSFYLTQIVRSALPWRYVGVVHEVIVCDAPHTTCRLDGLTTRGYFDSARNQDPRGKYAHDAEVLAAALQEDPSNARYAFYLAQSYRDAGQLEKALDAYQRRADMGGWDEEVWYSLYQIGVLRERLGEASAAVVESYLRAYQVRPARAEPLCQLARHFRERGALAAAYPFAFAAASTPRPDDILFLDDAVYTWRAVDEWSVSAYYVARYGESAQAAARLLREGLLPDTERARVMQNRQLAEQKLAPGARKTGKKRPRSHLQ